MLLIDRLKEIGAQKLGHNGREFLVTLIIKEIDKNSKLNEEDWLFLRNIIFNATRTKSRIIAFGRNGRSTLVKDIKNWVAAKNAI